MKNKQSLILKIVLLSLIFSMALSACKTAVPAEEETEPSLEVPEVATETSAVEVIAPSATTTLTSTPTEEPTEEPTETPTATMVPTITQTLTPPPTRTPFATATVIYYEPKPTSTPRPAISLSNAKVEAGQSFSVYVYSFPASVDLDFVLYNVDTNETVIYDGFTDANGSATAYVVMPSSAVVDSYWKVEVHTTELSPRLSVTSGSIKVVDSPIGEDAKIYLSSTELSAGDTFTATVTGFPANVNVDFKLINEDGTKKVIADGITDANGEASASLTIPGTAVVGETWKVVVYTTDLEDQIKITSGDFVIK